MDIPNKLRIISELFENVKDSVLRKVKDMPEDWDGIELRWYIAEKFGEEIPSQKHDKRLAARYNKYRNFVITTGNF